MKKKDLLKQFGERYITIEHNGGYLLYDKEGKARSKAESHRATGKRIETIEGRIII